MAEKKFAILVLTTSLAIILLSNFAYSCNETVCASIVSKCMLTQSCKCDCKKNSSCCTECFKCLSYLYEECCSCVDICPKPNETRNGQSIQSHVELLDSIPDLFKALTDTADDEGKWNTVTFPIDFDAKLFGPNVNKDFKTIMHSPDQDLEVSLNKVRDHFITENCTVAFMSQCLSWNKCKKNCQSWGATSYRWFHDGCCECVGSNCPTYGINQSRCNECPEAKDEDAEEQPNEDDLDYGEGNGPMDGDTNY